MAGVELLHVGLRALANRWLIDTCAIRRGTPTKTSGGTNTSWSDLATGVPCTLLPNGGASETEAQRGGVTAVSAWLVRLPYGQDVTVRDQIVVGARTFEVQGVRARTFEVRRTAECVEIT